MTERQRSIVRVQVIHCIIAQQENGAGLGQLSMHELLKVKTFHEVMPFLPEMQEMSRITPFTAPQGIDYKILKVRAILTVFTDSRILHGCYDTYVTIRPPTASVAH